MSLKLTIAGTDVSNLVSIYGPEICDTLNSQVNTCDFVLNDLTGTNKPTVGQEVIVTINDIKMFGGYISSFSQSQLTPGIFTYDVSCVDYTDLLNRRQVDEVYQTVAASGIIKDIIQLYAPGITCNNVSTGPTIDYISFTGKFPSECVQDICNISGYDYYVDTDKDLHFFGIDDNVAPYELNDSAESIYNNLVVSVDKSQLKNKVVVRGGYELSPVFTDDKTYAYAGQTIFSTKYTPYEPVSVYVNGILHTVGTENIDKSGFDFVVNSNEKVIKCLDHAALSANDLFNPQYKYQVPVYISWTDPNSIGLMKAIEGGSGIYESAPIVDTSIGTTEAAIDRAKAELAMYSNPLVTGNFIVYQTINNEYVLHYNGEELTFDNETLTYIDVPFINGIFKSGQTLTINSPLRNINTKVLINQVTWSPINKTVYQFSVDFATKLKGLTEFLLSLYDKTNIVERRDDIINEGMPIYDAGTISDEVPTIVTHDPSASPYLYNATNSRYNLAVWA